MARRYKMVRVPIEAYEVFAQIQRGMERQGEILFGKRRPVKMTRVMGEAARRAREGTL